MSVLVVVYSGVGFIIVVMDEKNWSVFYSYLLEVMIVDWMDID